MTYTVIAIRHNSPPVAFTRNNVADAIDSAFDLALQDETEVSAISLIGHDGEWWPKSLMLSTKATARRCQILPMHFRNAT